MESDEPTGVYADEDRAESTIVDASVPPPPSPTKALTAVREAVGNSDGATETEGEPLAEVETKVVAAAKIALEETKIAAVAPAAPTESTVIAAVAPAKPADPKAAPVRPTPSPLVRAERVEKTQIAAVPLPPAGMRTPAPALTARPTPAAVIVPETAAAAATAPPPRAATIASAVVPAAPQRPSAPAVVAPVKVDTPMARSATISAAAIPAPTQGTTPAPGVAKLQLKPLSQAQPKVVVKQSTGPQPKLPKQEPEPEPKRAASVIEVEVTNATQDSVVPMGDTQITMLDLMDLGPGVALGEFRLEQKIGEGGMGTVFSAVHPMIAKRAAIKILKSQLCRDKVMIERFIDEARVVNQIGHPNIVDIFAFGEMPDGRRYLAMEWLRGETLRDRIKRGPLSLTQMARVIRPLARALEAAHDKQVIHRDLKPENVFLVEVPHDEPHVKLLDFGIAKLSGEKRGDTTGPLQILGTPAYIAPEQARNADEAGPHADIYSLGAIAFELLTGRPPFVGKNTLELVTAHLEETPVAPSSIVPTIPDELDRLILDMLAKSPADRPTLSFVRSTLALIRDPADIAPQPRSILPRLKTEPPQIADLIESEVSGAARRPTQAEPHDDEKVEINFKKKTDESAPVPKQPPQPAHIPTGGTSLPDPVMKQPAPKWAILIAVLLVLGVVGAVVAISL